MSIKNTTLDKETQFVISLHISGTCMTVAVWHNHGRRLVVKTTSATSEASRLFDWGFFGVKTVVLPEKFACNFFIFWLHFYNSRQTFEAKYQPALWHGGTGQNCALGHNALPLLLLIWKINRKNAKSCFWKYQTQLSFWEKEENSISCKTAVFWIFRNMILHYRESLKLKALMA